VSRSQILHNSRHVSCGIEGKAAVGYRLADAGHEVGLGGGGVEHMLESVTLMRCSNTTRVNCSNDTFESL